MSHLNIWCGESITCTAAITPVVCLRQDDRTDPILFQAGFEFCSTYRLVASPGQERKEGFMIHRD